MRNALLAALVLTGCLPTQASDDDVSVPPPGDEMGDETPDDPTPPPPPAPVASGSYRVHTQIDLTVEAVLPESGADLVATLRDFSTNPAHTLFDVCEDAGVPAVEEIRDALPAYLEDRLEGWINGEIAKLSIGGQPVTAIAASIVALAETSLTQFAIDSELDVDAGTHRLTLLDLRPTGLDATFSLAELPADLVAAAPTIASERGTLVVGDHTYGLPYGEYAWQAVDAAVVAQYGTNLRGVLGQAIDCPTIAHTIANKCYWGYCVEHEPQLLEICERGLDEVVDRAHAKLAALRFDALHLAHGTAAIATDRLEGGTWTAEIDAGQGLRHAPATFTGVR